MNSFVLSSTYSFLYSEVWWMQTIIGAIIGAAATIIASVIVYQKKVGTIEKTVERIEDISNKNGENSSKEHSDLSKEHSDLSKEHSDLSKENALISNTLNHLGDMIKTVRDNSVKLEDRTAHAKEDYPDISQTISGIQMMYNSIAEHNAVMMKKDQEIMMLNNKIDTLSRDLQEYKDKAERYQKERNEYRSRTQKSRDDYEIDR